MQHRSLIIVRSTQRVVPSAAARENEARHRSTQRVVPSAAAREDEARHRSTTRPNIAAGAFIPRNVARLAVAGSQDGMPTPGQENSLVGTYIGIGRASIAGIPSFSATCCPAMKRQLPVAQPKLFPLWWTVGVTQPSSENGRSSPANPGSESGALFYDRPGVAERYGAHRHGGVSSPNFVMEEPALLAELGDVAGLDVLDLGCGDAALGAMLLQQGCASYLGIDGSQEMVTRAEATLQTPRGTVALQNMEELSLPARSIDLVVSRLALHYLEDLDAVLRACHAARRPGGRLCFSVLHPVITSSDVQSSPGPRGSWTVDDYFLSGARKRLWMGDTVNWFHRTTEQYVGAIYGAGFTLTALRECEPEPGRFGGDEAELARRRRVPLFLLLSARAT